LVTLIHRLVDPTRKRYYLVQTDFRRAVTDMSILNESEFVRHGWQGGHEIRIFAGKDVVGQDRYYGGFYGLPNISAIPKIKVGLRNNPIDVYRISGHYFVSNRAKNLLEGIDEGAFDFVQCDTITRHDKAIDSYWLMDVKRVVTEFDENNSVFTETGGRNSEPVLADQGITINKLYDIRMLESMPSAYHAFYLIKYNGYFFFDEVIVDVWRKCKFNSLIFSPMQPPTAKEMHDVAYFVNSEYFIEEMRNNWEHLES